MFNVKLAGDHLYGKQLFTWLSLVVSFMASFVVSKGHQHQVMIISYAPGKDLVLWMFIPDQKRFITK